MQDTRAFCQAGSIACNWLCPVSPLVEDEAAIADLFGPDEGFAEDAVASRDIGEGDELRVDIDDGGSADAPELVQQPRDCIPAAKQGCGHHQMSNEEL